MSRPQQISDDQILDAAREVFLAYGPSASVAQIAERLGVSQAAVFHRAGSKEDLMVAAFRRAPPPVFARLQEELHEGVPVFDQLVDILTDLAGFLRTAMPANFVMKFAGLRPQELREGQERPPVRMRHLLESWLRTAQTRNELMVRDPAVAADALLGAIEARSFYSYLVDSPDSSDDDRKYVTGLVEGLVPPVRTDAGNGSSDPTPESGVS